VERSSGGIAVRSFQPRDLPEIVSAWNEAAPRDPISEEIFRNRFLLDSAFDAENLLVAEERGQILGAVYGVVPEFAPDSDPDSDRLGWILFFFVAPADRMQGLGEHLLQTMLDILQRKGADTVHFSDYAPGYFLPGLDADAYPAALNLLTKLGFTIETSPAAMSLNLAGYELPIAVDRRIHQMRHDEWFFGTPTNSDILPLLALAKNEFALEWARLIRDNLVHNMPLERISIARSPSGDLAGWAMHGSYDGVLGRFGPFGVANAYRGFGLGSVLLHLLLQKMSLLNEKQAWFLWADEGSTAAALYEKAGFSKTRTFHILQRQF